MAKKKTFCSMTEKMSFFSDMVIILKEGVYDT